MIKKQIRDYLRDFASIRGRVDEGTDLPGVYVDVAARKHRGECIVISMVSAQREYGLGGEVGAMQSILQVRCWSSNPTAAEGLSDLVADKLSGFRGTIGDSSPTRVMVAMVTNDYGDDYEDTGDASDKFLHSYTLDYEIVHESPIPSLA